MAHCRHRGGNIVRRGGGCATPPPGRPVFVLLMVVLECNALMNYIPIVEGTITFGISCKLDIIPVLITSTLVLQNRQLLQYSHIHKGTGCLQLLDASRPLHCA